MRYYKNGLMIKFISTIARKGIILKLNVTWIPETADNIIRFEQTNFSTIYFHIVDN